jgi:hypothetical protein
MPTHPLRRLISIVFAVTSMVVATAAVSVAHPAADLQYKVDAYLAAHPGGKQISATEIAYGGGALVIAVAPESGVEGSPDCPSGWFCFYEWTWFGYPRGKLSDCGWQDLAWWQWQDRLESVHHNQSSGTVYFIDETGSTDTVAFTASPSRRTIVDASPFRNKVNYVYRLC